MQTPLLVLVGGFLGAGKTSLILAAANLCQQRGLRVAVITNDQDSGLVDTHLAEAHKLDTREIAGGCFCCRFSDLLDAAESLSKVSPHVIFAEPVGSCLDLSATIIQPLKAFHSQSFRVAPLTVLIDPAQAQSIQDGRTDPHSAYLIHNQLSEADILCSTKADLYPPPLQLNLPLDFLLSANTQEGVSSWLDEVLHGGRVAGSQLLKVDYARYAEAEAALGWLNLHATVNLFTPASPATLVGPLLESLDSALSAAGIQIAHLKIFNQTHSGFIKASICVNGATPQPEGDLLSDPATEHHLALNLRAIAPPAALEQIVSQALRQIEGSVTIHHLRAFSPPPPTPEHRFATVLEQQ